MDLKKHIALFLVVALAITSSYRFLDMQTAVLVGKLWKADARLAIFSGEIPDFLLPFVILLTAGAWSAQFLLTRKGIYNAHTRFFQNIVITLPLAFFLKSAVKIAVGRIDTRFWLRHPAYPEFRWLHGGGHYSSFPSGHMAVFVALAMAAGRYYPRLRTLLYALLAILALALVITNYHYVSDICAGAYLGYLVDYGTQQILARKSQNETNSRKGH